MQAKGAPLNALGPADDVRSPADGGKQLEFTSGVKRNARRASLASCTVCLAQTGLCSLLRSARSEIIPRQSRDKPPAPPCFCLPASPDRQDRVNGKIMRGAVGEGVSVRKGSCCGAWGLGWALFGLRTQCRCAPCAHLRWPTPVRLAPDSRVKGKDFQMFFWGGENVESRPCRPENVFSTLGGRDLPAGRRADGSA